MIIKCGISISMSFTFFFHIILAFTLLYTFNTYTVHFKAIISPCQDDDLRSYCTFVRVLIVVVFAPLHVMK